MPLMTQPQYRVELITERRKHFYDVLDENGSQLHRFPGVTGFLDVISKPGLLIWSRNEALRCVEEAFTKKLLESYAQTGFANGRLNAEWFAEVIAEAKKRPDKIKDDAANLGTKVHEFIDLIIHGKEPQEVPLEIQSPVAAFKDWWKNSGIELVLPDTKVASLKHKYGGSLDALGRRNGKYIILDWKTSNNIYTEYALQVAAYAEAFAETYGIYCQEAIIVRFDKRPFSLFDPKKDIKEVANLDQSFRCFLAAKALKESLAIEHFRGGTI